MSVESHRAEPVASTGTRAENRRAPSYEALRPLKPPRSSEFPVFDDLTDRLVTTQSHPDETVRFVLAVCAGYAYADPATVTMIMARLGLEDNVCRTVSQHVDAMLIDTTAHVIQSADGRVVILGYRGTVPMSGISWINDLDVNPHRVPLALPGHRDSYDVHAGFYRNVRATRPDVIACLHAALQGRSVLGDGTPMPHPLEALYLTGHSYGGAMAAMLTVMLHTEDAYGEILAKLRATYTYGAPMIGSPGLAEACERDLRISGRVLRYVYENDIVPQLPPRACGSFQHFGDEYRWTAGHGWAPSTPRTQLGQLAEVFAAPATFVARQLRLTRNITFHASLYDHLPGGYITQLTPADVVSEFGG